MVTLPREFVKGETTQLCVWVSDPASPAGALTLGVNHTREFYGEERQVTVILPPVTIDIPPGMFSSLHNGTSY